MKEFLESIKSKSSRYLLERLIKKYPDLPQPKTDGFWDFYWGDKHRLLKSYIEEPVYQIFKTLGWVKVYEDEFIESLKSYYLEKMIDKIKIKLLSKKNCQEGKKYFIALRDEDPEVGTFKGNSFRLSSGKDIPLDSVWVCYEIIRE